MQQHSSDLRRAYRTTVIIGLALMASLVIYLVAAQIIRDQNAPFNGFAPPGDDFATIKYALLGVAILEFFAIQLLNRLILSSRASMGTSGAGVFPPDIQRLVTAAIISFALSESVAIYGLVLFFIQGDMTDLYLFLLLSLFYFSIFFPKYGAWEAWMNEREKAARTARGR